MKNFAESLKKVAENHQIVLSEDNLRKFEYFRSRLLEWNSKINLTNITEPEEFATKHVIDSLMLCKLGDIKNGAKLIDVGTGPGIPGIIIKIYRPDISIALLESIAKKTKFLEWIVNDLGLKNVEVLNDRAENLAQNPAYREKFDVAVARAVSVLNTLTELCLPFVKIGGTFIAMKGKSYDEELAMSGRGIDLLGGRVSGVRTYLLNEEIQRNLIFISKVRECPSKYPRRPGVPGKNPL